MIRYTETFKLSKICILKKSIIERGSPSKSKTDKNIEKVNRKKIYILYVINKIILKF